MSVLRWEEPPPSPHAASKRRGPRSRYERIAEELRARPGEWAVIYEGSTGEGSAMPTHIKYGQVACFTPTGDFDATSRHIGGQRVVYARYVGGGDL